MEIDAAPHGRGCSLIVRDRRWTLVVCALVAMFALMLATSGRARAAGLPDGRAVELVTPPFTGGNDVYSSSSSTVPIDDDDIIWGGGLDPFGAGQQSGSQAETYLAQRTATGWVSAPLLPATYASDEGFKLVDVTDDLSAMVFATGTYGLSTPADSENYPNGLVYRAANGQFSTIVTDAAPSSGQISAGDPSLLGGMSADGQTVDYSSDVTPSGLTSAGGLREVYEWHPGGAVSEAGDAALQQCGVEVAGQTDYSVVATPFTFNGETTNAVSVDGSTVFLASGDADPSACPAASQIYVDHDGVTSEVSGTGDASDYSIFQGAAPDGSVAYFTQAGNLYRWTAAGGVTCDTCAEPFAGQVDQAQGNVVVSSNGEYAYFSVAASGGNPLYVDHEGTVVEVDPQAPNAFNVGQASVSQTGNVIVYDKHVASEPDTLYRAVVTGATATTPQCLSCQADGTPGNGSIGINAGADGNGSPVGAATTDGLGGSDVMSADGDTVVFTSYDALGTADNATQVYEWTPSTGPELIGRALDPGVPNGGQGSLEAAITPDGQDLYFISPDQLTPEANGQHALALYDARVDGGFPAPPGAPSCTGDACQGNPTLAPGAPEVGSRSACCGNVTRPGPPTIALAHLSAGRLRSAAGDGRLRVAFSVRATGFAAVRVTMRDGRRTTTVASARRRVRGSARHPARVTVTLGLSRAARAVLARTGVLHLTVAVSVPHARTRTQTAVLHRVGGHPSHTSSRRTAAGRGGRS